MITLGQHKSDINNQMIQLTYVYCVLLRHNIWLQEVVDYIIRDPIKRRALYKSNQSKPKIILRNIT